MKQIFLFILVIITPFVALSQLPKDIVNQNCYDSGWQDRSDDLLETKNAIYILGKRDTINNNNNSNLYSDITLTKTALSGELIWIRTYGSNYNDYPSTIIQDNDGMIYFSGWVGESNGDVQSQIYGGWDAWIVKIDTSGNIIWEKTYGGSRTEYGAMLLAMHNGNILAYGATFSHDFDVNINYGYLDFWIWEITPQGEIVNSRVFGSTEPDNIFSLIQTSDGGFFTAARAGANTAMVNGIPKGQDDIWLLKLDAELNIEWQKLIGGSKYDAGGKGVAQLADGGYIINGITQSSDGDVHGNDFPDIPDQDDIWVVRIDSIGNILWDIALGGDEWENESKIFQNQDGSFTVFGTTGSPNNGDVEGKHHTFQYPNSINTDIWMVQLSENGELLDQRCFGNAYYTRLRRGVIKKSDSHYLIAGTGISIDKNPDDPHIPTDGEVWGGYESDSYDIWFFEIKDCAQYPTEIPVKPIGPDTICTVNITQSIYTTTIAHPQYEQAQWLLQPDTAGEIINLQDTALINWNPIYEGQISLSLRVVSDCDSSEYSEIKHVQVYNCTGVNTKQIQELLVYPNPAKDFVIFKLPQNTKKSELYITNIYGEIISKLQILPQQNQLRWNPIAIGCKSISSGIYFYQTKIGSVVYRGKIVLNK